MRNDMIQVRRGTAAEWTSADPVLASGEFGYVTDTGDVKIGDGSTAWSSLSAVGGGGESTPQFLTSYLSADSVKTSITTFGEELELRSPTLAQGTLYRFELLVVFTADAATDLRFRINRSGLGDATLRHAGDLDNASAATLTWASVTNCAGAGASAFRMGNYIGFVQTDIDVGNVTFEWSQQTSGAAASTLRAGTMMMLRRIS